jgi:hypothetical protein
MAQSNQKGVKKSKKTKTQLREDRLLSIQRKVDKEYRKKKVA